MTSTPASADRQPEITGSGPGSPIAREAFMAAPRTRTTGTAAPSVPAADLGSAAQRDRRKRILDPTLALAAKGAYDAEQMRAVAQKGRGGRGTRYRCFTSTSPLLVAGLA